MNNELRDATVEYLRLSHSLGENVISLDGKTIQALRSMPKAGARKAEPEPQRSSAPLRREEPAACAPRKESSVGKGGAEIVFNKTGDDGKDFEALRAMVLACERCPHLVGFRHTVVWGVGNPQADIMFVGEAPGADEDIKGEPFVGKAGQLLTKMIETMGVKRSDVYIANVLKCRPDMPPGAPGNRKPTPKEMETCLPYLKYQIELIRPKVMVALGATALEGLLGKQRVPMSSMRGRWQDFEGIPFMPTYHPAYLLRDQSVSKKRIVWEDLLAVMERVGLPISEKQRSYFLKKQ